MNIKKSNEKIVLVTGGAGYIGSHMINLLLKKGYKVISIDNLSNSSVSLANNKANFIESDIADKKIIKDIFLNNEIYAIFHFASAIEASQSMSNASFYYKNNVAATINFLDQVINYSSKSHFIFSSTAAVYEPKDYPLKEKDKKNPINIYGKTKLIIEEILHDYGKIHNLSYGILRYFNVCGADYENGLGENRKNETHLIPLLLKSLIKENSDFFLYGNDYKTHDGTCVRDYIHVKDICLAHLKMLDYLENNGEEKCFNIGNKKGYSILEIVKKTEEITGQKIKINYKNRRKGDPDFLIANANLANSLLNWTPQFSSLENILYSSWQWEKTLFRTCLGIYQSKNL